MQVVSTKNKLVLHLCRHVAGRVSDHLLLRAATGVMRKIPKEGVVVRVDKGLRRDRRRVSGSQNRETKESEARSSFNGTGEDLQQGDEHSEDAGGACSIGGMKKFRLLAGIYRGKPQRYDENALVIAGLHNYRELGELNW